jgi:hypothetical protein
MIKNLSTHPKFQEWYDKLREIRDKLDEASELHTRVYGACDILLAMTEEPQEHLRWANPIELLGRVPLLELKPIIQELDQAIKENGGFNAEENEFGENPWEAAERHESEFEAEQEQLVEASSTPQTGEESPHAPPQVERRRPEMAKVQGSIRIGRNTAEHGAWLVAHGYEVDSTSKPGFIVVSGTEFVPELDLTGEDNGLAVLKAIIEGHKLLTYSTKAQTAKGPRSSIMLCTYLGKASALVVKPVGAGKTSVNVFASL